MGRGRRAVELSSIEWDLSIQCRASIDVGVVNDYAERMAAGDTFPHGADGGGAEASRTVQRPWRAPGLRAVPSTRRLRRTEGEGGAEGRK